jgi:hypothetical protein
MEAEKAYLDTIIEKYQWSSQTDASQQHQQNDRSTLQQLKEQNIGTVITVQLSNTTSRIFPILSLIEFCDTATSVFTWQKRIATDTSYDRPTSSSSEAEAKLNNPIIMELSLVEFDADAAISFMEVLVSIYEHQTTRARDTTGTNPMSQDNNASMSRKQHMDIDTEELSKQHLRILIDDGMIPERHIVECLKLAHYLQCRIVLDTLATILEQSIDSHNCMAICSLADALNLHALFEASVNFVIERLDAFQGTAVNESEEETPSPCSSSCDCGDDDKEGFGEIWASLPYDLRSRVMTMRNVMRSSIIGRGSKVSGLFFSSAAEFLAIMSETIRDQEERLTEARKRNDEFILERREEWDIKCQQRGPWFDRSVGARNEFVYGADVLYTLDKIEKQSRRLDTLRSFYEDQKLIFRGGGFESEIIL